MRFSGQQAEERVWVSISLAWWYGSLLQTRCPAWIPFGPRGEVCHSQEECVGLGWIAALHSRVRNEWKYIIALQIGMMGVFEEKVKPSVFDSVFTKVFHRRHLLVCHTCNGRLYAWDILSFLTQPHLMQLRPYKEIRRYFPYIWSNCPGNDPKCPRNIFRWWWWGVGRCVM